MSANISEQLGSNSRSQADTFFACSRKFLEGLEKMCRLNLQALETNLNEHQEHMQHATNVNDPTECCSRYIANILQPIPGKLAAYSNQACNAWAQTQSECSKMAERAMSEKNQQFQSFTEHLSQYMPFSHDGLTKAWQNMMGSSCEAACKMGQQVFESARETCSNATNQLLDKFSNTSQNRNNKKATS